MSEFSKCLFIARILDSLINQSFKLILFVKTFIGIHVQWLKNTPIQTVFVFNPTNNRLDPLHRSNYRDSTNSFQVFGYPSCFSLEVLARKSKKDKIFRRTKLFVGQKWRNFSLVTKILSDKKFCPTKILSDIVLSDKVVKYRLANKPVLLIDYTHLFFIRTSFIRTFRLRFG